jgi:hypothetical protein
MSGLDQRTKAHAEALGTTTAVNDSTPSSDAAPWPAVAGELLGGDALDTRRHSVPAFPLELLPQPWRDWIGDAARLAGAPVDYVAQAVLASVAGIGGRRVAVLPTPGWQEPLRLWLAAVGLSAAGKSPALESVSRQLWLLEGGRSDRSGGEPRSIKLPEAPFARVTEWLRRDRRGTVLWRDDAVACLAPPAGARSVRQLEPYAVSIVGTAQPGDVERTLRQDPDSAARFLYAWPQHQPFRRLPGLDLPSSALQPLLGRLLSAFDGLQKPHALLLDAPAAQAFEAFRARLHEERREADGVEAAWLGKGGGAVACLAGVFTLMSWAASDAAAIPRTVDRGSVERAVTLWWDYYRPHATALFRQSGPSEESRAQRVVRWLRIERRTVISRENIRRGALCESVDAREADDVIACLVEAGALRPRPRVRTGHAGRPALRWDVNPLLLQLPPPCAKRGQRLAQGPNVRVPSSYEGGGVMSINVRPMTPPSPYDGDTSPTSLGRNDEASLEWRASREGPRANRGNRSNPQTH